MEALIFDVQQDKLVWAAMSESKNPQSVDRLIKNLVGAAADQLKKPGLTR
jgi:hypothetical protein